MSAPKTNVETQERRHKVPLIALRIIIVGAVIALIAYVALEVSGGEEGGVPTGPDTGAETGAEMGAEGGSAPSADLD